MRRKFTFFTIFAAVAALLAITAFASVTFDPTTGVGFVGKGDVQLALGLNNAQLQAQSGNFQFTYSATTQTISDVEWICTNANNEHTQERARTTTVEISTTGVVSSVERVRNQITGFNLLGWNGVPSVVSTTSTDGPAINSCPANPSSFYLSTPAGDPVVTVNQLGGGLSVNNVPLQ